MSAVNGWDYCILAKSLSISGTIFFFYFIVKFIKSEQVIDGTITVLVCCMLTFLRPAFLLFVYIILAFLILRCLLWMGNIKNNFQLIILSFVTISIIFSYQFVYSKCNGIFALSDILVKNEIIIIYPSYHFRNVVKSTSFSVQKKKLLLR